MEDMLLPAGAFAADTIEPDMELPRKAELLEETLMLAGWQDPPKPAVMVGLA
jgi:hypothetical protein